MIFTAVQQKSILCNELVVFGELDGDDWAIQDTGYLGDMDKIAFDDPLDFVIKFNREIGDPIIVSMSKISNTFYIVYTGEDYINFDNTKLFVQETINHRIKLETGKVKIHGKSLAGYLHSTD